MKISEQPKTGTSQGNRVNGLLRSGQNSIWRPWAGRFAIANKQRYFGSRLIKQWLKAPVETTDGDGRKRHEPLPEILAKERQGGGLEGTRRSPRLLGNPGKKPKRLLVTSLRRDTKEGAIQQLKKTQGERRPHERSI